MKKLLPFALLTLIAEPSFAADMPVKAQPIMPPPVIDLWSGFYVGAFGGGIWSSDKEVTFIGNDKVSTFALEHGIVPGSISSKLSGAFGGALIGYGRQYGPWVLGLEIDGAVFNADKDESRLFVLERNRPVYDSMVEMTKIYQPHNISVTTSVNNQLDWFMTARGRLGYLVTPTTLIYATGGLAVGAVDANGSVALSAGPFSATASGRFTDTRAGWTVGAGIEQKFWQSWSIKAEYKYLDLGTANWTASTALLGFVPVQFNLSEDFKYHTALIGVNYRFGP